MTNAQHSEHWPAEAVRTCLTITFWLMAAGAAATLGLDLEGNNA